MYTVLFILFFFAAFYIGKIISRQTQLVTNNDIENKLYNQFESLIFNKTEIGAFDSNAKKRFENNLGPLDINSQAGYYYIFFDKIDNLRHSNELRVRRIFIGFDDKDWNITPDNSNIRHNYREVSIVQTYTVLNNGNWSLLLIFYLSNNDEDVRSWFARMLSINNSAVVFRFFLKLESLYGSQIGLEISPFFCESNIELSEIKIDVVNEMEYIVREIDADEDKIKSNDTNSKNWRLIKLLKLKCERKMR